MLFNIPSNTIPFSIIMGIKTNSPEYLNIVAYDKNQPSTIYINRGGEIKGSREFELKFPQTPYNMVLSITNRKYGNLPNGQQDKSFTINRFDVAELKTCPLWMDDDIKNFVEFAKWFSANADTLSAGDYKPSIYRSDNAKFCIDYYNKIRDRETGAFVGTPARIGHDTGVIEVSKADFEKYSIPMRMVILLHEFSHKYMNPKLNRQINDEISADINALNIYLSLGYPYIEAQYAFLNVFRDANNEMNKRRYLILNDFMKKFNNGELENKCTVSYPINKQVSNRARV
jgi:hypothetical protein